MSSEKKIDVSKVQKLKGWIDAIKAELITRIKKDEADDQTQQLKSLISENSRFINNKCTHNVESFRGKDELKGALNPVCEEKDVAVAHNKNINQRY